MAKSNKLILLCVFVTILIDMLGISILIPIYPQLSAMKFANQTNFYLVLAWLVSVYSLAQFIFSPILGQLSDKYGRRHILLISICITAFSYLLFAYGIFSSNLTLLFVARIIDGASGGNISIASSVIGDISDANSRPKNYAIVGISIGLGFILGPVIGGLLVHNYGILLPFYVTAGLAFTNLMFVAKYLPETNQFLSTNKFNLYKSVANIYKAMTTKKFRLIIIVLFLFNLGFAVFSMFWPIVLQDKFNYNSSQIGMFFGYLGLMILFSQGFFVRKLSGKVEDNKALLVSLVMVAIAVLGFRYLSANTISLSYLYSLILALGVAINKSFSSSLIARITPSNKLGEAMGINYSWIALANALPPLLIYYVVISLDNIIMMSYLLVFASFILYLFFYRTLRA